ncbi:nuclear polyadenylated RNA-binding protein-like protein Nab2 [Trematosphaeria pertusa]|uniref:Nuclear polyadenylated RNA-binding protein-like protein Nab2 n=1 Tax=Trematosphaeria pertusa TaxID=390896 RepID=A0A6A6I3I2_9PLEO|nr:nuclear polyadenylated RNA-binding protein-like protein Nab2 [Trematosphaeria pertusa]KAF2244846.1 nuclear polyadenylated RNA-binding protein-like protein Nab2 [Trematosphaeria pertusa]
MSVDFANGSPLATALQDLVQPKLAEFGWTTGGEDTTLFEYILALLANDKNEDQVASELSNDLLDLGPENLETQQFAHWLFEQIDLLRRQLNGGDAEVPDAHGNQMDGDGSAPPQDTEMEGVSEPSQGSIPTGPKAMRNGSGAKPARGGGRMLNQLNKQMNRNDDSALHRVRGSQGAGRINSHSREPPKGPRSQQIGRGLDAMANGRGMSNMNMTHGAMPGMNGMNMGAMPGMSMPPMGQNGMPGMLNPQQQMALMQMYEQQAHMMQQIFSGQTPQPFVNPNFQQGNRNKKPLNERMNRTSGQANRLGLPPSTKFTKKEGQDENMADGPAAENGDNMEVETSRPDPSTTMCKFNLRCTKPDCPFVHQSPAAPKEGIPVDMNDTCSYGAACKNKKCVGKHPSPAQRHQFQAEQECLFYPNCRDPANCPYKHPTMPACRNGADCTTPGCKFWHSSVTCKFNPCTNIRCPYKHAEGQKRNSSNVWVAPKAGEEDKKEHVSERKFIDESQEEELILPDKAEVAESAM